MKKIAVMLALASVVSMASATEDGVAPAAKQSVAPELPIAISVTTRDARGEVSPVGQQVTHGEPVKFSEELGYLLSTNASPSDVYNGSWTMTVSNVRDSMADSVAFDVTMSGKVPGTWEGSTVIHGLTESGSRVGVVHWLDGKDYLITFRRVAG
ncbi:hypothetical protein [Paraburkholderia sp. J8-2]|uniref:hypothetical protein n=1 Tax=Paraburkholderia sp. J8-2 TaxID=2805440 RepID=UPI002AB7E7BA|nr:hypothetical protein [Paraburkholderia sp. J8-2]